MTERTLTLYSTDACHLCEQAKGLVDEALRAYGDCRLEVVDVSEDDALFERYGWHIPVLRIDDAELFWPFDTGAVLWLLQRQRDA
jgi:glutaredoxin